MGNQACSLERYLTEYLRLESRNTADGSKPLSVIVKQSLQIRRENATYDLSIVHEMSANGCARICLHSPETAGIPTGKDRVYLRHSYFNFRQKRNSIFESESRPRNPFFIAPPEQVDATPVSHS